MSFEPHPGEGLFDHRYQPVDPNSPGVVGNSERFNISAAIAGGLLGAGQHGDHDLVENAARALEAMDAGNHASDRS